MATARGEEEPLLPPLPGEQEKGWWRKWGSETGKLAYLALPMVAVTLSQYAVQVSSNMMVGHLPGVLPLSSAAISTSLASVSGFSLLIGMSGALETLCGQAYGAKQYQTLGLHMYRAIVTLLVVCVPLSLLWAFMAKILVLIGQDPLIAHGAGRYIVWLIPGLFANAVIQPITKFLQSQSLIMPLLLSSVATLAFHVPLCWMMVFKTGMGYTGAALSISLSYWLNVSMLVAYIVLSSSCKETRTPPTIKAFRGVGVFLRLALPSAMMMCLEWWSFELLILMSGLLPNPELQTSVLSICLTSISLLFAVPFGLGAGVSTRVANELGAGNPEGARSVVRVVMSIAVVDAVVVSGILLASRRLLGRAYSSEEEVVSLVAALVPWVCITVVTDGLQGVLSGIARGCGWQHLGAYVNLGSFYLLGIPMAILLGFVLKMGARGLWMGVVCGSISQTTLLAAIAFFTNWQKMSNDVAIVGANYVGARGATDVPRMAVFRRPSHVHLCIKLLLETVLAHATWGTANAAFGALDLVARKRICTTMAMCRLLRFSTAVASVVGVLNGISACGMFWALAAQFGQQFED